MDNNLLIPIAQLGHNLILEDDDDTEEANRGEKVWGFAESTVPKFSSKQFKEHFRLNPDVFIDFLRKLYVVEYLGSKRGHPELDLDKQVMMTLWYIGNMESFRSVASRFGVTKSTCWEVIGRVCHKLLMVNDKYKFICWPSREKALENIEEFHDINGFPGVIAAIDGSHIRILPPKEYPNSYCNRKKFHSVLLQGICDKNRLFIDVYAGEPGSIHDSALFQKSDIYQRISETEFPNNSHIIGDLAYPLSKKMLVGYKDFGDLGPQKKYFNQKLSALRVCIEHSFALLKGRFRRLKYLETRRLDLICLIIVGACILHNICVLSGDEPDLMNIDEELQRERLQNEDEIFHAENVRNRHRREGEEKREYIADLLYRNRN